MGKRRQKGTKKHEQKWNQNCNRTGTTSVSDASEATMYPILEENRDDHISNLPDEILHQILSFLPFESALQTSFLSTRWNALWNITLVQYGTLEDIDMAVDGFLFQVKAVIDPLRDPRRLQFHFNHGSLLLATVSVLKKKLHLAFSTRRQEHPRQFGWNLDQSIQNNPLTFINTLHLTSVSCLTRDIVSSIVSKFQFLENLKISKCNGLRSLHIGSFEKLRGLIVLDCSQLKSLYIEASRLLSFEYQGPHPWFSFDYFWHLKEAVLDFKEGPGFNGFKNSHVNYLISLYNIRILTLCRWTFEAMVNHQPSFMNGIIKFNSLKELSWIDNSIQETNVQALLSFLHLCASLEEIVIHIDPTSYGIPSIVKSANQVFNQIQLHHVKLVIFQGIMSQEDEKILAASLLEVITTMPLIVAATHGKRTQILVRMPSYKIKQNNKKKKIVEARGKKYSFRFVKKGKEIDELCSKYCSYESGASKILLDSLKLP